MKSDAAASMPELIERVELRDDGIRLTLKIQIPCSRKGRRTPSILNLSRFVPLRMKRRGDRREQFLAAAE
jgi:hypothetical protein